jgi:hypothetical protein
MWYMIGKSEVNLFINKIRIFTRTTVNFNLKY